MTTNEYSSVLDEASRTIGSLLWQLWHHQGRNSPIGQPIREVLNIAPDAAMTDEQVAAAKRYGESIAFPPAVAPTPPSPMEAAKAPAVLTNEHVRLSLLQGGLVVGEHNTNLVADALRKLLVAPAIIDSGDDAMHVGNSHQTDACASPAKSESRSKSKVNPAVIHALATFDQMPASACVDVHVVAGLFQIATQTVWRSARAGVLPKPRKFGGSTRWNVGELRKILESGDLT